MLVNRAAVDVALRVAKRQAFPQLDEAAYLDDPSSELAAPVSDLEWEVLRLATPESKARPVFCAWDRTTMVGTRLM